MSPTISGWLIRIVHSASAIGTWTVEKEFEVATLVDFWCISVTRPRVDIGLVQALAWVNSPTCQLSERSTRGKRSQFADKSSHNTDRSAEDRRTTVRFPTSTAPTYLTHHAARKPTKVCVCLRIRRRQPWFNSWNTAV